ncbi:MAG: HdeD family acid-resistance protein [Planctomycetaceae bacterium]|nr:MAG: HdeD family acid-resistance protein [Planctomycetaceae bacterium]
MNQRKTPSGNVLMFTGIALVVLGIGAIFSPAIAGKAVVYFIGGLLLATGVLQVITSLRAASAGGVIASGKVSGVILGVITGLAGLVVLAHPLYGLAALTLVLAVFFVAEGIWKIVASFSYRPAAGWLAMLLSGVLGLVLGLMIWAQWPVSGLWAVGILVGVDLVSTGASLIAVAMTYKAVVHVVQDKVEEVAERMEARRESTESSASGPFGEVDR